VSTLGKGNRLPTSNREVADLRAEIRQLRLLMQKAQQFPQIPGEMMFSWSGEVSGFWVSGQWPATFDLTLCAITADYTFTSSGATGIDITVNFSVVHSHVLGAGESNSIEAIRIPVERGQRVGLEVTGVDGSELTVVLQTLRNSVKR